MEKLMMVWLPVRFGWQRLGLLDAQKGAARGCGPELVGLLMMLLFGAEQAVKDRP
jgi:hypothetical protein